jgi:predicted MPP superfamily phosphohydrolase
MAVRRVDVPLDRLSSELDGFTILHLSDLHLDLVHGKAWLDKVVERANGLGADLVAITGDLAEGSVAQYGQDAEAIGRLEAPHGVFFVTGNHEYFHDLRGWISFLQDRGIRVLRNEMVSVEVGSAGFDLAGVDDHDGGRLAADHGPDLDRALSDRNPDHPVVLLAHQPRVIAEAEGRGVDLVLSGHTHGGQIWPFSYLVYLQQPYVRGLIRHGRAHLYVSSGTGFWGPPMRLGTTAEMALIRLRSRN